MGPEWIVLSIAVSALLGGTALVGAAHSRRAARWQDEVEARWREAADSLGGTLEVGGSGALAPRELRLVARLEDVEASARATVPVEPAVGSYTEAWAEYLLGAGPVFEGHERGATDLPRRELPSRLASADPEALGAVLSPRVFTLLEAMPGGLTLRGDGERVLLQWGGTERITEVLERALRLVAALARHGADHLRELAAIDGGAWEPRADGGPRVRVRRGQAEVSLRVARVEGAAVTLATVATRRDVPVFRVGVDASGELDGALPDGVLDPSFAHHLRRVGRCALESDGASLTLTWRSPPTLAQAEAAVVLLAPVAAGSGAQGAFR